MARASHGSAALLLRGLQRGRPALSRCCQRQLATWPGREGSAAESSGRGGLAEQLGGEQVSPQLPQLPQASRVKVVSADRDFLMALPGSQQILLHDHRDTKHLKQISAVGLAGTLASSSFLAYAVSFDLGMAVCGGFLFQTVSAGLMFSIYLRTYVARAVVDMRRSRLMITGCSFFGEVENREQEIPLIALQPGASLTASFIKFRARGSALTPSNWVWYRMPRMPQTETALGRKPGAQVGFTPSVELPMSSPTSSSSTSPRVQPGSRPSSEGHPSPGRFPGAGLGAGRKDRGAAPAVPQRRRGGPNAAGGADDSKGQDSKMNEALTSRRKTLMELQLLHGLPRDAQQEQKILDFLEEPMAYAAFEVRQ